MLLRPCRTTPYIVTRTPIIVQYHPPTIVVALLAVAVTVTFYRQISLPYYNQMNEVPRRLVVCIWLLRSTTYRYLVFICLPFLCWRCEARAYGKPVNNTWLIRRTQTQPRTYSKILECQPRPANFTIMVSRMATLNSGPSTAESPGSDDHPLYNEFIMDLGTQD